jgi:serine/threonine protein phosphatase 1
MTNYTYAIGDIHGRYDLLHDLMSKINLHNSIVGTDKTTIVFLGDYVDRGPQSAQVVKFLRDLRKDDKFTYVMLKGNHEDMMVNIHDFWIPNGGDATIASYQNHDWPDYDYEDGWVDAMAQDAAWMHGLPTIHWDDHRVYVHAAVDEDSPLDQQDVQKNLWARYEKTDDFLAYGRHIVHGHTPQGNGKPLLLTNRTNIDTGACFKSGTLTAVAFKDNRPGGPVAILQSWGN